MVEIMSIYIPRMFEYVKSEDIVETFRKLDIGHIYYIDLHNKINKKNKNIEYHYAFVTIQLFDTESAEQWTSVLNKTGVSRVVYKNGTKRQNWDVKKHIERSLRQTHTTTSAEFITVGSSPSPTLRRGSGSLQTSTKTMYTEISRPTPPTLKIVTDIFVSIDSKFENKNISPITVSSISPVTISTIFDQDLGSESGSEYNSYFSSSYFTGEDDEKSTKDYYELEREIRYINILNNNLLNSKYKEYILF